MSKKVIECMGEYADETCEMIAANLAALYEEPFGGKRRGRFRIPIKLVRRMLGQRRIWPGQTEAIGRALYELGYVLHDMESYWIVVSERTFASYRRVNEASVAGLISRPEIRIQSVEEDDLDEAAE